MAHEGLSEIIFVQDMHERKAKMIQLAQCYIALPGGPGTLEEIAEVISWGLLSLHPHPCILLNHGGFYDPLIALFDHMCAEGFFSREGRDSILCATHIEQIASLIDGYTPPPNRL